MLTFWWAKFRKKKGGVKAHVLYDLESQVPAFFHISTASVYNSKAMKEIPYESGSYYVFDRGYNAFKELLKIHLHESFFVVRAKKNLQCKCCKWRRRLPKNILTDAEIEFTEYNSFRKYPERTTENAVRIQISSAIIAYCLVAIVQHDLQLKRSTYEVLQILSICLISTQNTTMRWAASMVCKEASHMMNCLQRKGVDADTRH